MQTHIQRATVAMGTWSCQDSALMKSKGEQGDRQVFDFRESKVGSGAHKEEASREQAGRVIQVTRNKRHGSWQCQEKGERSGVTPKVSLKEFGNQWGIWD